MDYQTSTTFAMHQQRQAELAREVERRRRAREAGGPRQGAPRTGVLHKVLHALDSVAIALHLHRSHVARPLH